MNNSPNKRTVIVGLFVLLGLLFLFIGILAIGNMHETFKKKVRLTAMFEDVNGLQPGNNIWFSGVKVGTVTDLKFYSQHQVKVEMKVEEKALQYIRKDAFVKLSSDGLIGNKILIIYGGTAKMPQVETGDSLGVEKTFSSDDMINTLQENNMNVLAITNDFKKLSENITRGEGTIGKLLNNNDIYISLDAAAVSLQKTSNKANELITSLNKFSNGLNKKGTLANELTTDTIVYKSLKRTVSSLQDMADSTTLIINNLKLATTNPNSTLGVLLYDEAAGTNMKNTLENIESSTIKLNEDLLAVRKNIFLRGYFKNKKKEEIQAK